MSTVQDVLKILRSHGDNPEDMERVLQELSKKERAKIKDIEVTLIDQIDCPCKCKVLADFYKMVQIAIAEKIPDTKEVDKPVNDWKIYLWGKAYRTNEHLINWCRNAVKKGKLPKRVDKNGNLFIYVNDLLPYNWQIIYVNGWAESRIDIYNVLQDGIIADGKVKKLAKKIMAGSGVYLSDAYIQELECGFLGYVAACNTSVIAPYLQAVGLGGWLD